MELGPALEALMQRDGISQSEVAKMAGVSQSTISRAIARRPMRNGAARTRLVVFMQQRASSAPGPAAAFDAVREIWDGSGEHAVALAKLILASGELWPRLGEDE